MLQLETNTHIYRPAALFVLSPSKVTLSAQYNLVTFRPDNGLGVPQDLVRVYMVVHLVGCTGQRRCGSFSNN